MPVRILTVTDPAFRRSSWVTIAAPLMPILENAARVEIERLLKLYSADSLRTVWATDTAKTKDAIAQSVSQQAALRPQVLTFVEDHFSTCKQHVYVLEVGATAITFPTMLGDMERVSQAPARATYIARVQRHVIVEESDGLQPKALNFLWPVRLDLIHNHLAVRFITLEKDLRTYFPGQKVYNGAKGLEEKDLIAPIMAGLELGIADLHTGIKALWQTEFMDAFSVRFKRPRSTDTSAMDEERGIREFAPDLYQQLLTLPLGKTSFRVAAAQNCGVDSFSVDPSKGVIGFPTYSEPAGETDRVIREILQRN